MCAVLRDLVLIKAVAEKISCLYVPVFARSHYFLFSAYLRYDHVLLQIFRLHKHLGESSFLNTLLRCQSIEQVEHLL